MGIKGSYQGTPRGQQIAEMEKLFVSGKISATTFQRFLMESSKHPGTERFIFYNSSFANGRSRAEQAIANKASAAGVKVSGR